MPKISLWSLLSLVYIKLQNVLTFSVIVDADPDGSGCHKATFSLGGGTTSRQWNLHVRQYACGDYDSGLGGPPGCLQYYTQTANKIQK